MAKPSGTRPRASRGIVWVFGAVFLWLAVSSSWRFPLTGDGARTLRTAIALAFETSFLLPPPPPSSPEDPLYFAPSPTDDRLVTSIYAPFGALLRAGSILASDGLPAGRLRGRLTDVSISLWPILFTAALVFPLARLFRYGGGGKAAAAPVAAALVLGSVLGPLGTSDFQEPMLTLLAALALERVLRARRQHGRAREESLVLAGIFGGGALLAKPTAFVIYPALFVAAALCRARRRPARDVALLSLGLLPFVLLTLWLNDVRFGSPFELGYSGQLRHPLARPAPIGWTILRLSLLPNRGLIWFAPILLMVFLGLRMKIGGKARRADRLAALIAAAGIFVTNALWWSWEGGMSWGPRLAAPCIALSAPLLWSARRHLLPIAVALGLAGFLLNLPGYLFEYPRIYWVARALPGEHPALGPVVPMHLDPARGTLQNDQRVHYSPECAPALLGYRVLVTMILDGDGPAAGNPGGWPEDSILVRLLARRSPPARPSDIGKAIFGEAAARADAMPESARRLALEVEKWGGPGVEARALTRYLEEKSRKPTPGG